MILRRIVLVPIISIYFMYKTGEKQRELERMKIRIELYEKQKFVMEEFIRYHCRIQVTLR